MTDATAALPASTLVAAKAPRDRTLLLLLPAVAMLVVMFLVPLVVFFVRTFMEFEGSTAEFLDQAHRAFECLQGNEHPGPQVRNVRIDAEARR